MSPILFNMAIDPLLYTLGFSAAGPGVSSFAFVDYLVLLSNSWAGMTRNLTILEKLSEMAGRKLNSTKCHSFSLWINGPKYENNVCKPWLLQGIHMMGSGESEKYLPGVQINPWKGILKPHIS